MLTCVYHPLGHSRVVEQHDAESMMTSGVWFDCPSKAKAYRRMVEEDLNRESKNKQKTKSQEKLKEETNEREQNGAD